ncbi:hypothetical protein BBO99_00008244 [Phytophthora kernoviae]|uniref:Uncharacterized protein n=2 Tax=Phytophthora kernoviae TaxID=325452 RepID=A0A3R7KQJ8_9STRA|nr:hypothetical protein G195_010298 [Phytophthora kernoviae 00238/432]KAG2508715.1 hypothetical protein JM16_008738 [Phytophthora kernoviae]KAG2510930.1 hypothetical protein JM18_008767 [Phytophthora kernoviae]RLN32337.1 hypothetical protein BBI17_008179 [Phytophthora kernoviae]RLN75550.1 hypothetical protein BBO99_00008244 [Phytophthora kernoviae]
MEIFGDGELEAEMHKREMKASSLSSWWQLFSDTYEELVQSIASPVRAEYSITELGDQQFSLVTCMANDEAFVREDFELKNAQGFQEVIACRSGTSSMKICELSWIICTQPEEPRW